MAQIPLTKGYTATVDDDDYDACMMLGSWRAIVQQRNVYAYLNTPGPNRVMVYLHRFIMGVVADDIDVDHYPDIYGLNNQRHNLRLATRSQNIAASVKTWSNSGFRGVHMLAQGGGFQAGIKIRQKRIHLGTFDTAIEASLAYEAKRVELYGGFAPVDR